MFLCVLPVIVAGIVVMVHWPALSAQALSVDDDDVLVNNYLIRNPGWPSVRRFVADWHNESAAPGYPQPVTMISLMMDYHLGGRPDRLGPFHRTSLILHALNTVLIVLLLYQLFGNLATAALIGVLFGVHPLTVEPVVWITQRKTLMAAFFALASLVLYVHYARRPGVIRYVACLLSLMLAMCSKPTSIPLPLVLLLLDVWPLRRLSRRAVLEKIPLFALAILAAWVTCETNVNPRAPAFALGTAVLRVAHQIGFYAGKIVWPVNLSDCYPAPAAFSLSNSAVLGGFVVALALLATALISLRWTRAAAMGLAIWFVALFPTMGAVSFGTLYVFDNYLYLPAVGLLLILAWVLGPKRGPKRGRESFPSQPPEACFAQKTPDPCFVAPVSVGAVVVFLLLCGLIGLEIRATRHYLRAWADSETHARYLVRVTPGAAQARNQFGLVLLGQGKLEEAAEQFREATRLKPDYPPPWINLGTVALGQDRLDEAADHFAAAMRVAPDNATARCDLGVALARMGRIDEAIARLEEAVRLAPDFPEARNNLGSLLTHNGRPAEAVTHIEHAIRLKPDYADARYNLADALAAQGRDAEAVAQYKEALRLRPDWPLALDALARILATQPPSTQQSRR